MDEGPSVIFKRHLDKKGLRTQQGFLLIVAGLMLAAGSAAAHFYGAGSAYAVTLLAGGTVFALFAIVYSGIIRSRIKDTCYALFDNRIEYQKGDQVLLVIPFSEVADISEERTQWQKEAGLTSVILEIKPESHLREEFGVDFFALADIPSAQDPSDLLFDAMSAYKT